VTHLKQSDGVRRRPRDLEPASRTAAGAARRARRDRRARAPRSRRRWAPRRGRPRLVVVGSRRHPFRRADQCRRGRNDGRPGDPSSSPGWKRISPRARPTRRSSCSGTFRSSRSRPKGWTTMDGTRRSRCCAVSRPRRAQRAHPSDRRASGRHDRGSRPRARRRFRRPRRVRRVRSRGRWRSRRARCWGARVSHRRDRCGGIMARHLASARLTAVEPPDMRSRGRLRSRVPRLAGRLRALLSRPAPTATPPRMRCRPRCCAIWSNRSYSSERGPLLPFFDRLRAP